MITFALEYFSCCSRLTTMKVSQTVFLGGWNKNRKYRMFSQASLFKSDRWDTILDTRLRDSLGQQQSSSPLARFKSAIHGLIVNSGKSDWLKIQNKHAAHDQNWVRPEAWCWPKGSWALGTRILARAIFTSRWRGEIFEKSRRLYSFSLKTLKPIVKRALSGLCSSVWKSLLSTFTPAHTKFSS